MSLKIERPSLVKVFASDAAHGNYLPVKFGTNLPVAKDQYQDIANDNYEFGLESLEEDLQMKDLNSVFFYQNKLLAYLFQQGVPEYSAYQDYPMGAVVVHEGNLWIATKDVKASLKEKQVTHDPRNPCCVIEACEASKVCQEPKVPSKETGWCSFVTHCEYDLKVAELEKTDQALQESIDALKGVEEFGILPNAETGALELKLSLNDGSNITIPMTKFGKFEKITVKDGSVGYKVTNPDGSEVELPSHKASIELTDSDGTNIGFVHLEDEKTGTITKTIGLVRSSELDQDKGFYWNAAAKKWQVDLSDLIQNGSGLEVDRNGNIKVKPVDFLDGNSLAIDPNTGKVKIDPTFLDSKLTGKFADSLADAFDHTIAKGINTKDKYGVKVDPKGGLDASNTKGLSIKLGNGITKDENGNVILNVGDGVKVKNGKVVIDSEKVAEMSGAKLAGAGLINENGILKVATVRLVDASGTVHLGNLVDSSR